MARTDKPKMDSNAAKKTKVKDAIPRQPRGERGTFAAKTPVLPAKASVKKKVGKAKAKQPQQALLEDPFPASETFLSGVDLPFLDIEEFSDYNDERNRAAINIVNETDFDAFVSKHCASPVQSLPERPVEISNPLQILCSELEPSSIQQPRTHSLPAPDAPPPQLPVHSAHQKTLTPPQLSVFNYPTPFTQQRLEKSAECSARSHRLPAIDMFRLYASPSPPSLPSSLLVPSVPTLLPASDQSLSLDAPPSPARTRQRKEVHIVSPSQQVCLTSSPAAAVVTPTEHTTHAAHCITTDTTSQSKLLTALSVRPPPQPLPPLPPAALNVSDQLDLPYRKGSHVRVTKGMHKGRCGVVRGVHRAGSKGPLQYGLWSVLLDGADKLVVALSESFLAKC